MTIFNLQNVWVRRLISTGFILLVAIIAHFCALLTWGMVVTPAYSFSSEIDMPKRATQSSTNANDSASANQISNSHLFGQFLEKKADVPKAVKPVATQPKKTPLQFVLMATNASDIPSKGMASIAQGRDVKLFWVGEDVFDKATLHAVYADKVEFERDNGDIEVLEYKKDKMIDYNDYIAPERGANLGSEFEYNETVDSVTSSARTKSTFKPSATSNSTKSRTNQLTEVFTNVKKSEKTVDEVQTKINTSPNVKQQVKRYVDNQINKAKSNPVSMLSQYGLKHISGKGYQVTSRAKDLMLLGLRSGDIVTSINGNRATTPEQDIKLIDSIMASGEILIEYERNGKVLVMKQALLQF